MKQTLVVLCVVGLLMAVMEAKKMQVDKKNKAKREVKVVKPEKAQEAEEELNGFDHKPHEDLVASAEDDLAQAEPGKKQLLKPKHLKLVSQYEQCKLECKKQRDQENAQEYVERLREELRQAEEVIAQQKGQDLQPEQI